ncbi:MAG TPA: helix-turn-helix transcriptional regulator [Solirubrobacteraceae bacterium]|nr:helix-turn-helix transcriptional regulator [Solirubrobacteraceae bacterium]
MVRELTVEHRRALFSEACAVIETHRGRDITLDEVAREIATSRRQLQRAFLEVGGVTFRERLLHERCEHAARQIAAGVPVAQVAAELGYARQSHFARAFRRHHGMTPTEYALRCHTDRAHAPDQPR